MLKYVRVYYDYLASIDPLNFEERGRLFTAILQYASTGESPVLLGNERFTFPEIKKQIDRELENYEIVSTARSEAGKKGGRPKANGSKGKQKKQMLSEESKKSKCIEYEYKDKYEYKDINNTPTALEIALEEFRQHRKFIKKPMNELAEKKLINQLRVLSGGDESVMVQILDQSIRNGWQGIFPLKEYKQQNYQQRAVNDGSLDHLLTDLDEV